VESMTKKETPIDREKLPLNLQILTDEEIQELRADARKQVVTELSKQARDEYFAKALSEARSASIPDEEIIHVQIDVAPWCPGATIDGVQYFHGYTYPVKKSVACVLFEQMWRTWEHQDELDGRGRSESVRQFYRGPRNLTIGPRHQYMPNSSLLGV